MLRGCLGGWLVKREKIGQGKTRQDRIRNEDVRDNLGVAPIEMT